MKKQKIVSSRGHRAIWCHSKRYTRSHCGYTFPGLLATINDSLHSVTHDLIRKFFRKTRETMRAYREGLTPGSEMTKALKTYNSS